MIRALKRQLRAFGREDGNMTIEFVIVLPMIFSIFMMSFEAGLLMMRSVMLERAVDMTIRELRLGQIPAAGPTALLAALKTRICSRTVIINNCDNSIRIELLPVDLNVWDMPTAAARCVDRTQPVQLVESFDPGGQHELMLARICVLQKAIFPTLGLGDPTLVGFGRELTDDQPGYGEYGLVAVSTFVNEPT
jgi:TadE-like protein